MTSIKASKIITEVMGECWHSTVQKTRYNYSNGCDALLEYCTKCNKVRFVMWENHINRVIALGAKVPKEHRIDIISNIDYTTPEGFFKAWRWAKEQEWWGEFVSWTGGLRIEKYTFIACYYVNEATFALTLAEWLKEREK